MPDRMPEDMPEDMPDRMPEDMSDRMPEDLPVTKCINVMVGRAAVDLVVDRRNKPIRLIDFGVHMVVFHHTKPGFRKNSAW